jgi:hypothetical protein
MEGKYYLYAITRAQTPPFDAYSALEMKLLYATRIMNKDIICYVLHDLTGEETTTSHLFACNLYLLPLSLASISVPEATLPLDRH